MIEFDLVAGQKRRIKRLNEKFGPTGHAAKQILFLPRPGDEASTSSAAGPLQPLLDAPEAAHALLQLAAQGAQEQQPMDTADDDQATAPTAPTAASAHRPPPPPLQPLTQHELDTVQAARAARGRRTDGVIKEWSDRVPLKAAEFARLRQIPDGGGGTAFYVNDEIVSSFLGLLNRSTRDAYAFAFDSYMFGAMQRADGDATDEAVQRYLGKARRTAAELLELEQLLFVVHVEATQHTAAHWYFMQSSREHEHIIAIDSCGGQHAEAIEVVHRFLDSLHAQAAIADGTPRTAHFTDGWRRGSLGPLTPQQPDGESCGIYVLIAIWCLMSQVDLHSRLRDGAARDGGQPVSYWRDRITLCLYCGGLMAFGSAHADS